MKKADRTKGNAPQAATGEAWKSETHQLSKESEMNSTPNTLPSLGQIICIAVAKAEADLKLLNEIRCNDPDWNDHDIDVDLATDLVLEKVRGMKATPFADASEFTTQWYIAKSALNLSCTVFSRKDCWYYRHLQKTCQLFEQLACIADFTEMQGEAA